MTALAQCATQTLHGPSAEFRLIPAGLFSATDGRPPGIPGWRLDRAAALSIVAKVAARATDFVIDYEHQTLKAAANGQPAPAAGWFKRLEWREGDGLYVTDARWTGRAAALILAKEYRFISPVFSHEADGRVVDVVNAALTNSPALDGLSDLAAASRQPGGNRSNKEITAAAIAYQEKMAALGVFVTTVQAVNYVSPMAAASQRAPAPSIPTASAREIAAAAVAYQERMASLGVHVTTVQAVARVSKSTNH